MAELKVKVPRVKSYKFEAYLKECIKARDAAVKAADPKLPVTKFTKHKQEMAE